jgi:hypothetical protein
MPLVVLMMLCVERYGGEEVKKRKGEEEKR